MFLFSPLKNLSMVASLSSSTLALIMSISDVNPSPSSWPNNFQVSNDAFKVQEGPMTRSKSKKLQEALIGLIQDIWKAQHKNTIPINEGQVEAQRIIFTSSNEVENAPVTNSAPDAFI